MLNVDLKSLGKTEKQQYTLAGKLDVCPRHSSISVSQLKSDLRGVEKSIIIIIVASQSAFYLFIFYFK